MWYVFWVTAPQLRTSYELRLRFDGNKRTWESIVLPCEGAPVCFDGDDTTTATDLLDRIFTAIGAPDLVPSLN